MKNALIFNAFALFCISLLAACSNINEAAWHSLKAHDAYQHPSLESSAPESKPITYDQYEAERKQALDKH